MADVYLPVIEKEDFHSFGLLLGGHFSLSYDDWLKLSYAYWHPDHRQEGENVIHVRVTPTEFARYLAKNPAANNLKGLLAFAEEISLGVKY